MATRLMINCSVALLLCSTAISRNAQADERPSRRQAFAVAMSKIHEGMCAAEVQRVLGRPDDVRTKNPRAWIPAGVSEIWGYGVDRHLAFPVLGQVQFGGDGRVVYLPGDTGEPPPPEVIAEETLAPLLRVLDTAPPLRGDSYDPRSVIRIVNALHPLGKEKSLAAIEEYLRVAPNLAYARCGLYVVLRVLFDVPNPPGQPEVIQGLPGPLIPTKSDVVPRFPVLLIDDIPLLLVSGYRGSGSDDAEAHLPYFRKFGTLRPKALVPPDAPLGILAKFDNMPRWYVERSSHDVPHLRSIVMSQLLRMTLSVHPRADELQQAPYLISPYPDLDHRWATLALKPA